MVVCGGVTIGEGCVIGAGSVVSKNIPDGSVAVGNPIRIIGTYDAYMQKCRKWISSKPCFDETKLCDEKEHMKNEIEDWGFLL